MLLLILPVLLLMLLCLCFSPFCAWFSCSFPCCLCFYTNATCETLYIDWASLLHKAQTMSEPSQIKIWDPYCECAMRHFMELWNSVLTIIIKGWISKQCLRFTQKQNTLNFGLFCFLVTIVLRLPFCLLANDFKILASRFIFKLW